MESFKSMVTQTPPQDKKKKILRVAKELVGKRKTDERGKGTESQDKNKQKKLDTGMKFPENRF